MKGIDLEDDSRFTTFYNPCSWNSTAIAAWCAHAAGPNRNIDPTGLGLERMAQILQQVPNKYERSDHR